MKSDLITITPESVALLQLEECLTHLRAATQDTVRVLQAAKALHAALVAALTAALAGSSGTGAYVHRVKERWLEFLESDREPFVRVDLPHRVMDVGTLLNRAFEVGSIEWRSEPLICTDDERSLVDRLTFIRSEFEHPKPLLNAFEVKWVLQTFGVATRLTLEAIEAVQHHLEEPELERARALAAQIAALSSV